MIKKRLKNYRFWICLPLIFLFILLLMPLILSKVAEGLCGGLYEFSSWLSDKVEKLTDKIDIPKKKHIKKIYVWILENE